MKIAMVASECNPLIKTGGLADVIFALSVEEVKMGEEVIIILPFYKKIKELESVKGKIKYVKSFNFNMSWRSPKCDVYSLVINKVRFYLLGNDYYFNRNALYGEYDDGERFGFFTMAAKELFTQIDYCPDIIHVHDWHPGMLPCIIKEDKKNTFFKNTKFVLTIHNPAFQGLYPKTVLGDFYNLKDTVYDNGKVRFKDQVSTLKSAIIYSDKITTVSPTHREELLEASASMGLNFVLKNRMYDFCGFTNGINTTEFNPSKDINLAALMKKDNLLEAKNENKKALLKEFHLKENDNACFALVSRLTWQKGVDLILAASYELCKKGCSIIVLGSGEYEAEQAFEKLRSEFPSQVGIYIGYNDKLAHKVYAGCDFFMMPSLFEPCGIGQMIAHRYASLPVVRRTGGLKDTVIGYDGSNIKTANGYSFDDYKKEAYINTCLYALYYYSIKDIHNKLVKNAFSVDHSWKKSATLYNGLYKSLIGE